MDTKGQRINHSKLNAMALEGDAGNPAHQNMRVAQEAVSYDPVNYDAVRFALPFVSAEALTVPSDIRMAALGVVQWSAAHWNSISAPLSDTVLSKGQKPKQGVLKDFDALEAGTDAEVLAFIGTWGFLGIEATPLPHDGHSVRAFRETTDVYRQWAGRIQAVLRIAYAVQNGRSTRLNDLALWMEHEREERARAAYYRAVQEAQDGPHVGLRQDPLVQEREQQIDAAREEDGRMWGYFMSDYGGEDVPAPVAASCLDNIINHWMATSTAYLFSHEGTLGKAHQQTRMHLSDRMRARFLDDDLARFSVLVPLGQALLHNLQSDIVLCKVCGKTVAEPDARVRKGFQQFCSYRCDLIDQRARNKANYEKPENVAKRQSAKKKKTPPAPD